MIPTKRGRHNPAIHDRYKYRQRSRVEQLFNKLKNWRRVATRYDKIRESCLGFVSIVSALLSLPFVHEAYSPWRSRRRLSARPSNGRGGGEGLRFPLRCIPQKLEAHRHALRQARRKLPRSNRSRRSCDAMAQMNPLPSSNA